MSANMSLIFFLAKTNIFKGEEARSTFLGDEEPFVCFMLLAILGRLGGLESIGLNYTDLLM